LSGSIERLRLLALCSPGSTGTSSAAEQPSSFSALAAVKQTSNGPR
jgi:hypothetical protein